MMLVRGMGMTRDPGVEEPMPCTQDALVCSDGSTVGRVAPDCAFASCPEGHEPVGHNATFPLPIEFGTGVMCAQVMGECPDGSFVGYDSTKPGCTYKECPGGGSVITDKSWYQRETPIQVGQGRVEVWMVLAALAVGGFMLFKAGGSQ